MKNILIWSTYILRARVFAALILVIFNFEAIAEQSRTSINDKKTLVLSHDYTAEEVIKESTAELVKNFESSYHGDELNVDVVLLGEKTKIIIPGISESFLHFRDNFRSARLYLLPTTNWLTLKTSIARIIKLKSDLEPLKKIAISVKELDLSKLNEDSFKNNPAEGAAVYELENSRVVLVLKKLNTPKEVHPRDQDYFQVIVIIDIKESQRI